MTPDLRSGVRLSDVEMRVTPLQLFRFSAATWNSHRIHFDADWARREGHAGLVVHSHLHAANALRVLTDGLGPEWGVTKLSYRIIRPATLGDTLTASAELVELSDDGATAQFTLREVNQLGEVCLEGAASANRRT